MAYEFVAEVDERLSNAESVTALVDCGVTVLTQETDGSIRAVFPRSGMGYFQSKPPAIHGSVRASGVGQWKVGTVITFRLSGRHEGWKAELREFLERLSRCTTASFAVSVDLENLVAVKDKSGLRFLNNQL